MALKAFVSIVSFTTHEGEMRANIRVHDVNSTNFSTGYTAGFAHNASSLTIHDAIRDAAVSIADSELGVTITPLVDTLRIMMGVDLITL